MSFLGNGTLRNPGNAFYLTTTDLSLYNSTIQKYLSSSISTIEGDIQSTIQTWWAYPALGNVNFQNFEILSTTSIQLDEVFLSATANSLLINGVPVVTSTALATLSSITDWAYFQALSTVDMGGSNTIQNCAGIELNNSLVTTGGANTIQVNGQNPVAVWSGYAASGTLNMNFNNIASANNISCTSLSASSNVSLGTNTNNIRINSNITSLGSDIMKNVNISTLFVSTLTTPVAYTTSTFVQNVILSNTTNSNVLTTTGATLLYNGAAINTGSGGNVALWANYVASGPIRSQQGVYNRDAIYIEGRTSLQGRTDFYNSVGATTPAMSYRVAPGSIAMLELTNAQLRAQGSSNWLGNSNTYNSQNYLFGGTTIDGGNLHGCSIGCLPAFTGINTMRIDVLPIGMLLTSPTTIGILATTYSFNVTGSANMAAGGAMAIAAGSYITLEHGFGAGSNGIYVQTAARSDVARLLLEFGGSVGPSIDNPANPAKVDFHGTNLFIQTITNTFNGNRWPRTKHVFIDSVSTLKFVNNTGITVKPDYGLEASTAHIYVSSVTATGDINAYNLSSVNLYLESMFCAFPNGQINVYDTLAGSKAIYAQTILGAPTVRASTIYGTSGASVDGQLFLQTPLVTATNNLRVTNTLYSQDARFEDTTTLSTVQSFVGEPVTFANGQTNMPNNVTISTLTVQTVNGYPYPLLNQSGYMTTSVIQAVTTTFTLYDSLTETFTANTTGYCTVTGILTTISTNAANWYVNIQIEVNGVLSGNIDSYSNTGNGHQTQVTTIWRFPTVAGTSYTIALFMDGSAGVSANAERGTLSFISGLV